MIFQALDAKKAASKEDGHEEIAHQRPGAAFLRRMDRQSHRHTAGQQDSGIERAIKDERVAAGFGKRLRVSVAIDNITQEHRAEKENFRGQECPHAESGGLVLLRNVLELLGNCGVSVSHGSIPPPLRPSIGRAAARRSGSGQNYASAAGKAFATRGQWLSRD